MNRNFKTAASLAVIVLASTFLIGGIGGMCDDLGQITFTIEHETDAYTLDLDQALEENKGEIDGWDQLPDDGTGCVTLSEVLSNGLVVFPDPMKVDLGDNEGEGSQVSKYRNHIEDVQIKELTIIITANSLSFAIPAVELYAGPYNATKSQLQWVAETGEVTAGFTGDVPVQVTTDLLNTVGSALEDDMRFSFSFYSAYDDEICKGDTLGTITAKARVVADVVAEAL